jgi:transposase
MDLLIRRLFGSKSEKLDAAQLELLLKDLDLGKAAASAEKAEATWPKDLPVEQEVIEPAEVRANPEAFRCIGEELTEMLDYRPVKFFRRQIIRRKFVRRDDAEVAPVIAPLPESLQQLLHCCTGVTGPSDR